MSNALSTKDTKAALRSCVCKGTDGALSQGRVLLRKLESTCGTLVSCAVIACYTTETRFFALAWRCSAITRHEMTLHMVHQNLDTRHVTMRRFPTVWINKPEAFLHTAMKLCTHFGQVVEIVDVSNQQRRQDDDRDGERTLEVKYLHAESGIMAMRGLSGQDIRTNREKKSVGGAPPHKENQFVCQITGSPVVIEGCDCDDLVECNALCRIVWRPKSCPCSFRWRRPPNFRWRGPMATPRGEKGSQERPHT